MAEKQDNGPPPLENPNSLDYICVECHNKVNSLCLLCLEKALHMTSFTRIYKSTPQPMADSDRSDYVCETCDNTVKSLCLACMETAQLRSNFIRNTRENSDTYAPQPISDTDRSDSAYDVDIISDSSRNTDTTLDIDFTENFDETGTLLKYVTMKRLQCKSLILGGRFERNSDTESDYSDLPPLEETKKFKYDSDEDSDDFPPLVPRT